MPLQKLCKLGSLASSGALQTPTQTKAVQGRQSSRALSNGPEAPQDGSFAEGSGQDMPGEDVSATAANANEPVLDLPALETGLILFFILYMPCLHCHLTSYYLFIVVAAQSV